MKVGTTTTQIGQGAFNAGNNYQFSGTVAWPAGANSIVVSSVVMGTWGNGNTSKTGSSVTVNKPSNCPGQPGVTKAVSCSNTSTGHGDGTIVLTLTNSAGVWAADVIFKVYNPDQTTTFTSHTVAHGQSKQVTFSGLADGNHSVKITSGATDLSQTFTVDCDSPVPSSSVATTCGNGDGQVLVTLTNSGGEAVVFDITDPKTSVVEHVTVAADSSTTRTYSGFADGTYTVTIKVGATDLSKSFTIDCDQPLPKVTSTVTCDDAHDGSITITLANEGTEAVIFHVTNPTTNSVEDVTVAAGSSTTRTFGGFVDGTHSVAISAGGQDYTQTFTSHCDLTSSYSLEQTCSNGDGNLAITLINNGDDVNAVFVVEGNTYTVAPGASTVVALNGHADGVHTVNMTINGVDASFSFTVDCDRPGEPAVLVDTHCADEDGVVVITLKNIGGQLPLTFTVEGTDYVVPADSNVQVVLTGHNDGNHVVTITQGDTDFSQPFSTSCDLAPTVDYTQSCVEGDNDQSDGQIVLTLRNNGDDVDVIFTVNGDQYTVAPKASQQVTIGGLTDGNHHIAVTAGALDLSFDVTGIACDHPGQGSLAVESSCSENDGVIAITLIATGGEKPVIFTVNGVQHSVEPDTTELVTITGLNDGSTHVNVLAGQTDLSFDRDISCDPAPKVSYSQACAEFDDTVTVLLQNPGDDLAVTFTVNGTDYTLAPGETLAVLVDHLADGPNTINVSINGVAQPPFEVTSDCDPVFVVTPVCNTLDVDASVALYWFTISNTEAVDLIVAWNGGSATVPAGQTINVASTTAPLVLTHAGVEIARAGAAEANCERDVVVTKQMQGQPQSAEVYTVQVSRLVDGSYVAVTTFDLNAGESKTIHLPSTLDPAGIDYKIAEIASGTASTSNVSPDSLKLSGHLGETIGVVVTNGYASVRIDKSSSTTSVLPGGQVTYTLQAVNTGGLTLDPVVVTDRLPSLMSFVSATVAGGAGQCSLAQSARPQLISCTINGALAPGASAPLITVLANADAAVTAGTTLVNQAMVHGAFTTVDGLVEKINTASAAGGDLSCIPVISGSVCDLSAKVGVPVTQVAVEPSTGVSSAPSAQLPRTGAANLKTMLALGFSAVLLGGVLLLSRRRATR
jgi:uncharacterized repeat protein (TIGR01451 family)/LPXTG-motif cell wall-anchored protein